MVCDKTLQFTSLPLFPLGTHRASLCRRGPGVELSWRPTSWAARRGASRRNDAPTAAARTPPLCAGCCTSWRSANKPTPRLERGCGGRSQRNRHRGNAPFLPCGHLDFESAVTAQNDEFKVSFDSSSSRSLNAQTKPRNSTLSLDTQYQ